MIVVGSSALVAILLGWLDRQTFEDALTCGERRVTSAVNVHETGTVLRLRNEAVAAERFWQFPAESAIEVIPFDELQVRAAAKARLDLSDRAAYRLVKTLSAPPIFKGNELRGPICNSICKPQL
jgi:ribonuclease VapC